MQAQDIFHVVMDVTKGNLGFYRPSFFAAVFFFVVDFIIVILIIF